LHLLLQLIFNRIYGEDLVKGFVRDEEFYQQTGQVRGTSIKFSELQLYKVTENESSKSDSIKKLFCGIFYVADFNKNFTTHTLVVPNTFKTFFQSITTGFLNQEKVALENPQFEKLFEVYAEDQVEARYILSTNIMNKLVDFRNKTGHELYISFIGDKIYIAISTNGELFEPKINKTLYDFNIVKEYYEDLMLAAEIVEMLNLNLRIWTKGF
jgi:hypothetical protein